MSEIITEHLDSKTWMEISMGRQTPEIYLEHLHPLVVFLCSVRLKPTIYLGYLAFV